MYSFWGFRSGKSIILNIIAGLLDASTGDVFFFFFDGVMTDDVPTNKRDVHTVFQSYALFPHMNVSLKTWPFRYAFA